MKARAARGRNDMLTLLADYSANFNFLNVFRYLTFRTGGATATALFFVFFFGPRIIAALRLKQVQSRPLGGSGTITGCPGALQPWSQHLPGWRLRVIGRFGSWATPRSSSRSTSSTLEPTG